MCKKSTVYRKERSVNGGSRAERVFYHLAE